MAPYAMSITSTRSISREASSSCGRVLLVLSFSGTCRFAANTESSVVVRLRELAMCTEGAGTANSGISCLLPVVLGSGESLNLLSRIGMRAGELVGLRDSFLVRLSLPRHRFTAKERFAQLA